MVPVTKNAEWFLPVADPGMDVWVGGAGAPREPPLDPPLVSVFVQ